MKLLPYSTVLLWVEVGFSPVWGVFYELMTSSCALLEAVVSAPLCEVERNGVLMDERLIV